MTSFSAILELFLTWFISLAILNITLSRGNLNLSCNEKEKQALLSLKQGLSDPGNRLFSWSVQTDYCTWTGVKCDNTSSRVTELHLSNPYDTDNIELYRKFKLGGEISPLLVELEYLTYLDFSWNSFQGTQIPSFLGSMRNLRHLNLQSSDFEGLIPYQLGNLTDLHYLSLGYNDLHVDNLDWISQLVSLEYLNMNLVDLHIENDWFRVVSMLSSISELHLSGCQLGTMIPFIGSVNFTTLHILDLSDNNFSHAIPSWLFNLSTTISYLDLSFNTLTGKVPEYFGKFEHMTFLNLQLNALNGQIPSSLGNLTNLRMLYLGNNRLNGSLPKSLGAVSSLEALVVGYNSLSGIVAEVNFANLKKLKVLDFSGPSLSFEVNSYWVPPFQLEYLFLISCKVGPGFPAWLQTQRSLKYLDISTAGISGTTPSWFWNLVRQIELVNLSDNQIDGDLSNVTVNSTIMDLSSNAFTGQLPSLLPNVKLLNVANNSISGHLDAFVCNMMNIKNSLEVLVVSNNLLSGELSNCWMYWKSLIHLNLGSNNLSGRIPNSMASLYALKSLKLNNNSFSGDISSSLQNCSDLGLIDFSENRFSGTILGWIAERSKLKVFSLRSNELIGKLPIGICNLSSLTVLDLANNTLSGFIPNCLNHWSSMADTDTPDGEYFDSLSYSFDYGSYELNLLLVTKGRESDYSGILKFIKIMDISSNNLSGSIPREISSLFGLRYLNLSNNHLTGKIPEGIGNTKSLESLDLSKNHLSGDIPWSMSELSFLNNLNLSFNNFSGQIPTSTQIQSLGPLSFIDNPELCGPPLEKSCTKDEENQDPTPEKENEDDSEKLWFYISMGIGYAMSFWGVCSVLIFKRTWRHAYFKFLDKMYDQVYIATVLKVRWFHEKFRK